MKTKLFILVSAFVLCSFSIINKSYFAELVEEKLEAYATYYSPEKIYVHTDKPYYALDETIWFTSYLVDGVTHEKAEKSWVIHVELFDGKDSLVAKRKLFTNNLSVGGDIKINKNLKPGNYILQAYTNYMKNDSSDYFFKKQLKVFDPNEINSIKTENEKTEPFRQVKPNLKFYPEGGDLVENIRSKVAIKIENIGLNGADLFGTIVSDKNEEIAKFNTSEYGLGIFTINPKPNTTYKAILNVKGVTYNYDLPNTIQNGHTLSISKENNQITVHVTSNENLGLKNTYLVAHQRGELLFNKFENGAKETYTVKIPTSRFNDGVVDVTLFNSTGNPVCERLVYIANKENTGVLEIIKSNEVLGVREKLTLSILPKNSKGELLHSNLSLSIRDLSAFPYNRYNKNIKTYLLLNSDLRGEIQNPGYFFDGEFTKKKQYLLDLLMLTNGWRRFTWKDLLFKKQNIQFTPERGLYISGKTFRLKQPYGPVTAETKLILKNDGSIFQTQLKKSTPSGNFKFGPFVFFDSIQGLAESKLTSFESEDENDRNVLIIINSPKSESKLNRSSIFSKKKVHFFVADTSVTKENVEIKNYLKTVKYISKFKDELGKKRELLDEVTVIAQKQSKLRAIEEEMNSLTLHGEPTHRLDFEHDFFDHGLATFDMLNTLPGVILRRDPATYAPIIRINRARSMLILLDGIPTDPLIIDSIDISQISFMDVLRGSKAAMYGVDAVIAVYTKIGNPRTEVSKQQKRNPGIIEFKTEGFYTTKEFYSPDHSSEFDAVQPDIRTTLYWQPKIVIDSTKTPEELSFFTSDSKGDYLIEVEGISASGIPLQATSIFTVE